MSRASRSLSERLWEKVDKRGKKMPHMKTRCWEWTGGKDRKGYGRVSRGGRPSVPLLVHRVVWEEKHGPTELHVLHRCDNPPCVRPSHLFKGTHTDNMRDMEKKGRNSPPPLLHGRTWRAA